ncbi:MAG: hypothetical protein A3F10_06810 [Coxiella sp. RIFCSPHIGHO2_12_FULL_42_15]|nr:MAG: hypothetical protein A3F10_06810 [Coxiella sp. RIFCSPHIGHO2_12_FULL_42_15]
MVIIAIAPVILIGLSANLTGCAPGQNTPGATLAGAAAGGLLGAAAFHGQGAWLGIVGGALVGGLVGSQIGRYMDRQDLANMNSALTNTPPGDRASWTNKKSNVTYTVTPIKEFKSSEHYCREYQTTVTVGGKVQEAYGKACRMSDGQWKIAN